jgi:hypothetical protein
MLNKLFIFIFAEPTVNSKSFREKLYGFFTYIIKWLFVKPKDVVYEHPEIKNNIICHFRIPYNLQNTNKLKDRSL